ncbi:DUF4136 domain-containing protein [Psychromonas sp. RZ22]|uniref:DUF4136 domain-containing protein n=1 Tax=Psychromonas algarum TaxID=2555643 RepID=UPI0010685530|nr:DUF4136 domain-containing protein [Psychromonas sp. RZ22]TEW54213.1 DUF4136 domain-containing protein [Psychromonas sp. RZ22]
MNKIKIFIISILVVITTACASNVATVDFDKNSDIDTTHYKTFAWLTKTKIMESPLDSNPVLEHRISNSIEQAFIAKGYQLIKDAEKADFTISYTMGSREKLQVNSYPTTYGAGFGWGLGYYGSRGYNGTIIGTETTTRQYTEGKLAIDVYDVKTHQPAFHGWATKRITSDDKESATTVIDGIVKQVVSKF